MKGFLRKFFQSYSGLFDRHRMLWILGILICFGLVYYPRYTQENEVREKILENGWSGTGMVTRVVDASFGRFLYSFEGMELYSPQVLEVGNRYQVTAVVQPEDQPRSTVRLQAKSLQELPLTSGQWLQSGYFRAIGLLQTRMQQRVFQAFYPDTAQLILGFAIGKDIKRIRGKKGTSPPHCGGGP